MPARWGLSPVFVFEWLVASRRWQMYAVRALVVLILLGALVLMWEASMRDRVNPRQAPRRVPQPDAAQLLQSCRRGCTLTKGLSNQSGR